MSTPLILTQDVAELCDIWFDARASAEGVLPRMEDLDLTRLARFMPAISAGALDEEGEPRIILFGTGLTEAYGQDMTGARVRDLMSGDALREYDTQSGLFQAHPVTGAVHGQLYVSHVANLNGKSVKFEGLTLPYATRTPGEIRRLTFAKQVEVEGYGFQTGRHKASNTMHTFDALGPRPDWLRLSAEAALAD